MDTTKRGYFQKIAPTPDSLSKRIWAWVVSLRLNALVETKIINKDYVSFDDRTSQ